MTILKGFLGVGIVATAILSWFGWQLFSVAMPVFGFASVEPEMPPPPSTVTVHFASNPEGAEATTPFGWTCRTPCSMELMTAEPLTVTFTHDGYAPITMPVQVQSSELTDGAFGGNTIFGTLTPSRQKLTSERQSTNQHSGRFAAAVPRKPQKIETEASITKTWKAFLTMFRPEATH